MNSENLKIGITVDDWDALRATPEHFAALQAVIGTQGAIILSTTDTDALPVAMRDFCPRTYVTDTRTLSTPRLARLCGKVFHFDGTALVPRASTFADVSVAPRFGMIVSNGFGLGHVTRLQALAAGLAAYGPAQFMSFSAGMVKNAFYLPSPQYLELDKNDGLSYVREATRRFIAHVQPTHVVYDGNNIPPGVLAALAAHPDIHLTWIRRGMWQPGTDAKFMAVQAMADLVIEPGDLADAYDTGPSWNTRNDYCPPRAFLKTPAIRPKNEVPLSIEQVAAEFAIDLKRKHALLMLGAMQKGEDRAVLEQVIEQVRKAGYVPVIAHWPISHDEPPQLRWALTIERMPIAKYYDAFDVIISAAGYNSFHEILAGGYPAVFIPQEDEGRDQQLARSRFAADQGLAQICRRTELDKLHDIIPQAKATSGKADWLEDFDIVARAMGVEKGDAAPLKRLRIAPNAKILKVEYKGWKRRTKTLYQNTFVLALDMKTEKFLQKAGKLKRQNTVIVTDSVDPIQLRRAGFKYVWINGPMLSGFGLTRQFINWLSVWKPKKIRDLNSKFG